MYGVEPGHSDTASGHAALTATIATPRDEQLPHAPPAARRARRSRTPRRAPAATIQPCSIFVMKASPTIAPASARCRVRPDSTARTVKPRGGDEQQHQQRVGVVDPPDRHRHRRDRQRRGGQHARGGQNTRRTVAYSSPTAAIVHSACGSSIANEREAEHARRQAHQPQRQRRLVDGDEAARDRASRRTTPSSSRSPPWRPRRSTCSSSRTRSAPTGTAAPRPAARPRARGGSRPDPRAVRGRASGGDRWRRGGRAGRWWRTTQAPDWFGTRVTVAPPMGAASEPPVRFLRGAGVGVDASVGWSGNRSRPLVLIPPRANATAVEPRRSGAHSIVLVTSHRDGVEEPPPGGDSLPSAVAVDLRPDLGGGSERGVPAGRRQRRPGGEAGSGAGSRSRRPGPCDHAGAAAPGTPADVPLMSHSGTSSRRRRELIADRAADVPQRGIRETASPDLPRADDRSRRHPITPPSRR